MIDDWDWIMRSLRLVPPEGDERRWAVEMAVYAGDRPTYRYGPLPHAATGPFAHTWLYDHFAKRWQRPHDAPGCDGVDSHESLVFLDSEEDARACFDMFKEGVVIP